MIEYDPFVKPLRLPHCFTRAVKIMQHIQSPIASKFPITYKRKPLEVNSQHQVFVTNAKEGPELFTVQLVSEFKKLKNMMDEINRKPLTTLLEPPMIGSACLGRRTRDHNICRAIITNLSRSQCELFFVDFGDTEILSYYDIFNIPVEYVEFNVPTMRMCLSGGKKLEKGPHLNETFKELTNMKVCYLKVVPREGPPLIQYGELFINHRNILDMLTEKMKLQFKCLEILSVGAKCSVLVSYIDSCKEFYIQHSETIDELTDVMESLNAHCENSSSPRELAVGNPCCARFPDDGKWYRAQVKDMKRGKVVVSYVDYGNEQEVEVSDLRTITPELLRLPGVAMKCALKGFDTIPVETKTSNQLIMLALEKTFMCHVIAIIPNNTMLVTLVDDSVVPTLDIARKMDQFSQPTIEEVRALTQIRTPVSFLPEGSVVDECHERSFQRERSFKEERRPPGSDDQRPIQPRFGRRGGGGAPRPCVNNSEPADNWERAPQNNQLQPRQHNGFYQREDRKERWCDDRTGAGAVRTDRRENRTECIPRREQKANKSRSDFGIRDRNEFGSRGSSGARGNLTPRDRAGKSFEDNTSDESLWSQISGDEAGCAPGKFTQVQYKEIPNPVPLDTAFEDPAVELGAQNDVSVTWIHSPESFYIQILSLQLRFTDMMNKIPELYKGVRPYAGPVPVGASVLARYPVDRALYRATVHSLRPFSKLIVRYVDYGNKDEVDVTDIWQLDRQLMELPRMAVHCALLGVAPAHGEWKADAKIDLCFNAPRYQCVFRELTEEQYRVSLWNDGVSVADTLIGKQLGTAVNNHSEVILKGEPIDMTIIVGQQILCRVTHVERHDLLYVQLDLEKETRLVQTIATYDHPKVMIHPGEYHQALQCTLHNYSPESQHLLSLEQLKENLTGNKFILHVNDVDGITLVSTLYEVSTGAKVEIFSPDPGACEAVAPLGCTQMYISHIATPGHFWLQALNSVGRIEEIQAELRVHANSYAELKSLELGTVCAAKYLADKQWYRAEILAVQLDIIAVRFVDYGYMNILRNLPGILKVLPNWLRETEWYAIETGLNAVPTGSSDWSDTATNCFTELVGDLAAPVHVLQDKHRTFVDVFVSGVDLTAALVAHGYAARERILPSCFASNVISLSEFWIQLKSVAVELHAMKVAMVNAASFPKLAHGTEGLVCAARWPDDGAWYRAQVVAVIRGFVSSKVFFMDNGKSSIVTELRTLPDGLKEKPPLSRKCALQKPRDLESWSQLSKVGFKELAADGATEFTVRFVTFGDISTVELYLKGSSVTELLVRQCEVRPRRGQQTVARRRRLL